MAISSLNNYCADMRSHIAAANKETGPVLEEATTLMTQKKQVEAKQQILSAFSSHFLVSDEEATVLTSTAEPVNEEFFQVLTRVKKIHHDSQVLLGTENQQLGLEVLEQSSKQLNSAFQKLYRWIQRDFKTLDLENPQISASVRRSLRVLAERPTLFQSCLDSFAEARETILSDSFHAALTGSSSDAHIVTKPIEFQAHDPLRYIGDMLAWAHSTTVSEREALENLFISDGEEIKRSIQAGLESEPWLRDEDAEVFDGRKALNQLVSRDLIGVARLLRQRTEQVIQSHDNATLAYKIANLIGFYKGTFAKLLGSDSEVLDVFDTLEGSAMRQFRANMRDHVAAVQSDLAVAPADLSPPEFLDEALQMLRILAKSYETSAAVGGEEQEKGFSAVLAEALDPFMSGCVNLQKGLQSPEGTIFAVNCLFAAKETLAAYSFTAERVAEMNEAITGQVAQLVDYQHQYFLHESGLVALLEALADITDAAESLKSIPDLKEFKPDALIAASQQLDEFLPSAVLDASENLKKLRNRKLIQEITDEAAGKFCEDFEFVESKMIAADELTYDESREDEDQEPGLRDLFPRTSGEIRVLLS